VFYVYVFIFFPFSPREQAQGLTIAQDHFRAQQTDLLLGTEPGETVARKNSLWEEETLGGTRLSGASHPHVGQAAGDGHGRGRGSVQDIGVAAAADVFSFILN